MYDFSVDGNNNTSTHPSRDSQQTSSAQTMTSLTTPVNVRSKQMHASYLKIYFQFRSCTNCSNWSRSDSVVDKCTLKRSMNISEMIVLHFVRYGSHIIKVMWYNLLPSHAEFFCD